MWQPVNLCPDSKDSETKSVVTLGLTEGSYGREEQQPAIAMRWLGSGCASAAATARQLLTVRSAATRS